MGNDIGDISDGSKLLNAIEGREFFENIIDAIRDPLIVLSPDLKVLAASKSFYKTFKVKSDDTVGSLIYTLGDKEWDIPKLRALLERIIPEDGFFDDYKVEKNFPVIGNHIMLLNARAIPRPPEKIRAILLSIEDITVRRVAGKLISNHMAILRKVIKPKDRGKLLFDKIQKDADDFLKRIIG